MALLLIGVLALAIHSVGAAQSTDAEGFQHPPKESRPETWFHLIGGNVGKAGLTADLEAIAGAGIRGIQLFHGQFGGPWPGVEPQVPCLSPQWDSMIDHASSECRRLGLSFSMENCPGWSMAGGPWITPDKAMRELIWSRRDVVGGKPLSIELALPQPSADPWRDYGDVAVIAFPTPTGDDDKALAPASVRSNREQLPWAALLAGRLTGKKDSIRIEATGEPAWVEVEFAKPVTLRSLEFPAVERMSVHRNFDPGMAIRVQTRGPAGWADFVRREIPRSNWQDNKSLTLALPERTVTSFRIVFELANAIELPSLKLSSAARIDDWEGQAAHVLRSLDRVAAPAQDSKSWLSSGQIVDLSDKMTAHGTLSWNAPSGNWTILRFGNVNSGRRNGPAPKEATGFECDKLSTAGADLHFAGYIGRISAPGGPADRGRLHGMVLDSWECLTQTWTPAMEKEFATRRGYTLRNWLPALAGYVIDDHARSERFLRDWRATVNDLLVENFFGRLAELGRERGMKLSFETAVGDVFPGDILQYFGKADIPMCEFWQPNDPHWGGLETKPIFPTVSAAHIYGKPRIAAESFTNTGLRWDEHPFMLKHLADRHFTYGLNHLVFHTYTHNPRTDVVPGSSFGAGIGTPFLRNQTWWKYMPLFTDYLARCQYMLEKGRPVADVLWYLGDELDHKPRQDTPFPAGFHFDYLNQDVLLNRLRVVDGNLTTPEGVTWRLLWLRDCPRLTPETLVKLHELLRAGATVLGNPPLQDASLSGGADADAKFTKSVRELWGDRPGANGDRKIGEGHLIWGCDVEHALAKLGIEPDIAGASSATWCHRRTDDADIYFIAAARDQPLRANLSFRSGGRPELSDPLTGTSRPAPVFYRQGARTVLPLDLPAAGSAFVVFRKGEVEPVATRIERNGGVLVDACDSTRSDKGSPPRVQGLKHGEEIQPWVEHQLAACEVVDGGTKLLAWESGHYRVLRGAKTLAEATIDGARLVPLDGPWTLSFPSGWDAPERLELPKLVPWSDLENPAARSFSGSATYNTEFNLDALSSEQRVLLDLGQVANIAEVTVNGKPAAALWTAPFRTEITQLLKPGVNRVTVTVTNTWRNRLAYDAGLPEAQRKTWTIAGPPANAPREAAGLRGPVVLHIGCITPFPKDRSGAVRNDGAQGGVRRTQRREPITPEYLENDQVRIGVDLGAGGGIFSFSQKTPERNLLNHFDKGRFIQQSYYGVHDGSKWDQKAWRWNPVQGGGWNDRPAKVLEFKKENGTLYVKTRPKHWATQEDVDDATMEEWLDLRGDVAHIRFRFVYTGTTRHPAASQELPAVFVDYALPNLVFYHGDKPWTDGTLTRRVPGFPNENGQPDESWAAYVDDKDWGIGAYFPDNKQLTCYRAKGDGKAGPVGSACSYFAPVEKFAITPGLVHEYDFFVTIGDLSKIRQTFQKIHEERLKKGGSLPAVDLHPPDPKSEPVRQ